jgi:heme/copper-type cytochrome/quinol oxidase subunit 4
VCANYNHGCFSSSIETSITALSTIPTYSTDAADIELSLNPDDSALTADDSNLIHTSSVAQELGALWNPSWLRTIVLERLQAVTCEGETILVTLPVDHRIGSDLQAATLGVTILGATMIALILCFLYFFHLRSAIKASSPLFLLATIAGMLLMFISGSLLTHNDPTDTSCNSGWWLLNIGFHMTFGPLFAKCWRIYKIFMRKEMTVIRLTDANLFARLAILIAAELVSICLLILLFQCFSSLMS